MLATGRYEEKIHVNTEELLTSITDTGQFERVATRVLRAMVPLYFSVVQSGVNVRGQSIKDPVDGICFSTDNFGIRYAVAVEHTITRREGLERKWLSEKDGDVVKAARRLEKWADYRRKIVLTCSSTVSSDLVDKIEQYGSERGLEIDIWDNSRLSQALDTNPDGQYIRSQAFGVPQTRLSKELALEISDRQLAEQQTYVKIGDLVERDFDVALPDLINAAGPLTYIVGRSGLGKTSVCLQYADYVRKTEGIAFVIHHDDLDQSHSIEQALFKSLSRYTPELSLRNSLQELQKLFSGAAVFLWIEDINKASDPSSTILKVDQFSNELKQLGTDDRSTIYGVIVFCPVWPKSLQGLTDQARKSVDGKSIELQPFSNLEARVAVKAAYHRRSKVISDLKADGIAVSLASDPLLIGLLDPDGTVEPAHLVDQFVTNQIERCAANAGCSVYFLERAAAAMSRWMIEERASEPELRRLFYGLQNSEIQRGLEILLAAGSLVGEESIGKQKRLGFRHDRVRDHLLSQVFQEDIEAGRWKADHIADPFYSELLSIASVNTKFPQEFWQKVMRTNPLVAFKGLNLAIEQKQECSDEILKLCQNFVNEGKIGTAKEAERRAIEWEIAKLQGERYSTLLQATRSNTHAGREARILNGDVRAMARLCLAHEPSVNSLYRDRLVSYTKSKFGPEWLQDLSNLICDPNLNENGVNGALNLAGECSDASLAPSVLKRWRMMQAEGKQISFGILFAGVSCGTCSDEFPSEELLAAWANFQSSSEDEQGESIRQNQWDLGHYGLSGGLRRIGESRSIGMLIEYANVNPEMGHAVYAALDNVDHPAAAVYVAEYIASIDTSIEGKPGSINILASTRLRSWDKTHRSHLKLGRDSKEALRKIWSDTKNSFFLRKRAFQLWGTSMNLVDCRTLQATPPAGLEDEVIRVRCFFGDPAVAPQLRTKLRSDEPRFWFQFLRYLGTEGFEEEIKSELARRRDAFETGSDYDGNTDWTISELLAERCDCFSEVVIRENWEHLSSSRKYLQVLLFLATDWALETFHVQYLASEEKGKLFEHLTSIFGIKHNGRNGIKGPHQLRALEPYLIHLDQMFVWSLWEDCNDKGYFDWRKVHLDPILRTDSRFSRFVNIETALTEIDELLDRDKEVESVAYSWSEIRNRAERNGEELVSVALAFFEDRQSPLAATFFAEVIKLKGKRSDLPLLMPSIKSNLLTKAQYDDTVFTVQLRTLN